MVACADADSGTHRCRYQRPGRHAGRACQRLLDGSILLLGTSSARTRSLVLPADVQVSQVLLLQELCVHALSLLVRVPLRLLCPGQHCNFTMYVNAFITTTNTTSTTIILLLCCCCCCRWCRCCCETTVSLATYNNQIHRQITQNILIMRPK